VRILRHGLSRLERLAGTWLGAVTLFAVALGTYAIEALAWPLIGGRDLDEYLLSYVQLLDRHPVLPWAPLFRTPLTGIVVGSSLDIHGGSLAEPIAALLFAGSMVLWSAAALAFGRLAAVVTALALLTYPGYALIFHELASEPVMATVFAGFALAVTRAARTPSAARFALVGVGIALLALTRPGNAVLLVVGLFPLALRGRWRERLRWTAALVAAAVVPLAAWSLQNGWRYGDYSLARGGNALVPFYQVFLYDKIVSPKNGPASRRLAAAVQQHLLTRDPYKSYGIKLDSFFSSPSFREHEDLYTLSDETWGWNSAYSTLRKAALEAIREHPGAYASGAAHTIWTQLSQPAYRTPPAARSVSTSVGPPATVVVAGRRLPAPTEGQSIPAGQTAWISRPDHSIQDVWTGPTEHRFVFRVPSQRRQYARVVSRESRLARSFPTRVGNRALGVRLNQLSHRYPPAALWLAVGAIAIALRRPRGAGALLVLALAALVIVVFNGLGLLADSHFMLPVAPAFVLFAVGALLGERAPPARSSG
jgi:Dolichyl-phosphate-mannose-protein mannosyltransferase